MAENLKLITNAIFGWHMVNKGPEAFDCYDQPGTISKCVDDALYEFGIKLDNGQRLLVKAALYEMVETFDRHEHPEAYENNDG